jgi:hypothetical protein
MFCLILAILLQIQPVPDPVPNGDFGGPLESLREWIDSRFAQTDERLEKMEGGLFQSMRDAVRTQVENLNIDERIANRVAADMERRNGPIIDVFSRLFDRIESLLNLVVWIIGLGCVLYLLQIISRFIPAKAA